MEIVQEIEWENVLANLDRLTSKFLREMSAYIEDILREREIVERDLSE